MSKRSVTPVIYFIFCRNAGPTSTRFGGFARRLIKSGKMPEAEYRTIALEDLTFVIDSVGNGIIYDKLYKQVLHDASFVYFKSWESMPEHASMVASYLQAKGIPFEDQAVRHAGLHKASQTWKLWKAGARVIPTIVASSLPSQKFITDNVGNGPYLTKPIHGEKGRGVTKYSAYSELPVVLDGLLLQPYLENKGDYRVLTYGYMVRGALYRTAAEGKITNNTSQGGESTYVAREGLSQEIVRTAEKAARVTEHAVAGVDIVLDKKGNPCVLEVNQGSQIVTGHFTEKKMGAFADYIRERYEDRYARKNQNNRLEVIGRYVHVDFPEFDVRKVFAKVDTGAYQSAIHATDIREVVSDGKKYLEFSLLDGHERTKSHSRPKCRVNEYTTTLVRNSSGHRQVRYVIQTRISINGRMMKTGLTLTDRKDMVAPVLLGRRFLRGRYLVNVELSRNGFERGRG